MTIDFFRLAASGGAKGFPMFGIQSIICKSFIQKDLTLLPIAAH